MAPLSFTGAEMMAMCLESILYGIYASLFIGGIQTLVQKRATSGLNTRLLAVSIILFVLITWHEVIDTVRLVLAFQQSQTTSGADLYYAQVGSPLSVLTTSVYLLETFVSDLFILYRCYIVWNAYWPVVILPILLFIADCGTGVAAVYTLTLVSNDVIFNEKQEKITNSFFSCTLALNAICTGLIAFRIWWSQYQNREVRLSSNLMHLTIIIVDLVRQPTIPVIGAIYLVTLILLVATYSVKAPAFKVLLDIVSSMSNFS
ncbi:hypothetical protein BV25DRAFT_1798031 [Artomyces pyxidatus]|uniref:Uncharacterized protein n=1 Tax=Artomyces pyxidatus TaxID=48021 RepID=A0ACB8TC01_9AGAM|nr:hypothetical protein BV25DRAFT_1798031 [Artomyces pyxidatus]